MDPPWLKNLRNGTVPKRPFKEGQGRGIATRFYGPSRRDTFLPRGTTSNG